MIDSKYFGIVVALCTGCAWAPMPVPTDLPSAPCSDPPHADVREPVERGGPVTLDALLAYARANAPRSIEADALQFAAEAETAAARQRAQYNPVIAVSLGSRTQARDAGLEAQAGIQQRIEIAGERRSRMDAARQLSARVEREREAAMWAMEIEVRRLYALLSILDDLAGLTDEAADAADELAAVTQKKADAGDEPALTAELARARAALVDAQRQTIRAEREAALGQLRAASGWPGGQPLQPTRAPRRRPALPSDAELTSLAVRHSRNRAALQAEIERARAGRQVAKREAWPEPTIGAGYTREANVANNQAAHVVLGTLSFPIPVFARNQAGQARARAAERTGRAALRAFDRSVPGRVQEPAARVRGALHRIDALTAAATARDAKRLTALREAYTAGEVGLLPVLRALEQTIETRTAVLAAEADFVNAIAQLEQVIGTHVDRKGDR